LEMVVKEEMVVVAKGKLLTKEQIARDKREAQGTRCQERRNAAPPSARKESPTFSNPWGLLATPSTSGTGPKTSM
jgi:hypothetical protein